MHLLLRNCHVISPAENINGRFDILIANGVIIRMGVVWQHVREIMQYDLAGKVVVPGFFDMHVHFREPGQTHKEDIATGALSAAHGGFTGVVCMPNTNPPLDNPAILKANEERSRDNIVNVYSSACATMERKGEICANIEELIQAGAVCITDDGSPIAKDDVMKETLERAGKFGKLVVQHCEVMSITNGGIMNEGDISRKLGVKGIPNESEYSIIERDIALTEQTSGARYHVQHISTKEAVELVRKAKAKGLNVTAEACPHHFTLTDEAILKYGTDAKMNPPLRTQSDVDAVIEGIKDGTIDAICTDHAPHTADEKSQPLDKAPFGIVGLETAIGLTYTHLVEKGVITFEEMINKMSVVPRRLMGLPDIKIAEGNSANLTILDLNAEYSVDASTFHSRSKNTPFDGWKLKGKPVGIVNNHQHLINI